MGLSVQTMRVYDYVRRYHGAHGYGPSVGDIAEALGLRARSAAHYHLRRLRDAGLVAWERGVAHSVRPVADGPADAG